MANNTTVKKAESKTQVVTTEFTYRLPGGVLVTKEEWLNYMESIRN